MLTLITGTPGAGKSLYAVAELARKVPGSTVEVNGEAKPRRLLSNVKDLLIEHEHISADNLNSWHEWAQPGDVILFDEVQEVWRPRALGKDVPPGIAKLETHRHMGVDIILITQHPMLLDSNIRRLVNQHLHVRRIASGWSMVYEWDHCSNVSTLKTALQSKVWRYPKDVFSLYKSAQAHTKPTTRIPRIAYLGIAALIGCIVVGKVVYDRVTTRFDTSTAQASSSASLLPSPGKATGPAAGLPSPVAPASSVVVSAPAPVTLIGCIASSTQCRCWDDKGIAFEIEDQACRVGASRIGNLIGPSPVAPLSSAKVVPAPSGGA